MCVYVCMLTGCVAACERLTTLRCMCIVHPSVVAVVVVVVVVDDDVVVVFSDSIQSPNANDIGYFSPRACAQGKQIMNYEGRQTGGSDVYIWTTHLSTMSPSFLFGLSFLRCVWFG